MLPKTMEGWKHFLRTKPDSFYMEHCDGCHYFYECVAHRNEDWKCFKGWKKIYIVPKEYVTDKDLEIII